MAIFCSLDSSNIVVTTFMIDDADVIAHGGNQSAEAATWVQNNIRPLQPGEVSYVQTSPDGSYRAHRASPNWVYDSSNNVFYEQQPSPRWSLNASWGWEAPVAFPAGAGTTEEQADIAVWDEAQSKWYYIDASENRFNWDASSLVWVAA